MSGRFAGSKTVDERRRRRLATEDAPNAEASAAADPTAGTADRPLPTRRPTARFPLQRLVSRSSWKLAGAAAVAAGVAAAAIGVGFIPGLRGGAYGPGLASFAAETGRLPSAVGGLLLIAAGQLAWIVRWARGRSLRDFGGRYRVWWWTSVACVLAGTAVLTSAPAALAATLAWAFGPPPVGGEAVWATLPALLALVLLFPGLRRDTRDCRSSRTFLTLALLLWVAAVGTTAAEAHVAALLAPRESAIGTGVVLDGLWLAGAVAAFVGLLAHVRHVVYESVEPPAPIVRMLKAAAVTDEANAAGETPSPSKPEKRASRRKAAAVESTGAKPEPAAEPPGKPHVILKGQVLKNAAPAAVLVEPPKPAKVEPPKPAPKPEPQPVAVADARRPDADWSDEAKTVEINGRKIRLDGPEDPAKGLSKRERRALRKATKGQGRSFDGDDDGE